MPLSDRTKRLLEWWQLHIGSTKKVEKETKENVERINASPDSCTSASVGNDIDGQGVK